MLSWPRSLSFVLRGPRLRGLLQTAPFSRIPANRVMQEAENRFRVSNEIDVRELGDSLWGFLNYPGDLLVMQGHGITPVSTVLKSIAHASRIRDRPIDVLVTGAPADTEGAFGGRSRELWIAAMKPEEEGSPSVVPKEPIRVGAKTQSASLGGFISHKLKEEGVALLQGSSAVTIAKMADGIAIAGAHFNGEEGRPSAHLVCRLRTILVEADATVSRDGEDADHAGGDGSPSGDTTVPPRPNRIRVMQILVRLKEGPIQGSSSSSSAAAAAQPHSEDEANDAEVTMDSISGDDTSKGVAG